MNREGARTTKRQTNTRAEWRPWLQRMLLMASTTLALSSLAEAHATPQKSSPTQAERTQPEERWYGLPIVVADGAAIALLSAAAHTDRDKFVGLLGASVALYTLGGPIVHVHEREIQTAAASFGLRVLPLAVGGPLFLTNINSREPLAAATGAGIVLVGGLAAIVVDIAGLAWKPLADAKTSFVVAPVRTPHGTSVWTLMTTW